MYATFHVKFDGIVRIIRFQRDITIKKKFNLRTLFSSHFSQHRQRNNLKINQSESFRKTPALLAARACCGNFLLFIDCWEFAAQSFCLLVLAGRPLVPVNKGRNNFCLCLLVRVSANRPRPLRPANKDRNYFCLCLLERGAFQLVLVNKNFGADSLKKLKLFFYSYVPLET